MPIKHANIPGYPNMPLNIWGKATMLLNMLYQQGLLPECHIYGVGDEGGGEYEINGIRVGNTEEQVTTCIWLMVESYAAEGHIDFQDNATVAEAAMDMDIDPEKLKRPKITLIELAQFIEEQQCPPNELSLAEVADLIGQEEKYCRRVLKIARKAKFPN